MLRWDEGFQEFAVEWDGETYMSFFVNGELISTIRAGETSPTSYPQGVPGPVSPIFHDVEFYLMLQTAVGGPWPGEPTRRTEMPVYHTIDYVRYEVRGRVV